MTDKEKSSSRDAKQGHALAPGSEVDRWVVRFTDGPLTAEEARAFNTWLISDPQNEVAFERAQQAYERASVLRSDPRLEEWLKPSAYERAVSAWLSILRAPKLFARPKVALPVMGALSAAMAAFVFLTLPQQDIPLSPALPPASPDIVTQIAEIRGETLPDGSVVTLGAASSIDVQFTPEHRKVVLLEGEAFFDVEHDPTRPFLVAADNMLVRVLGTKFDVSLSTDAVDVAVSEGRVEVIRPSSAGRVISEGDIKHVLTAGQKVTASQTGSVRPVEAIAVDEVALWREGELIWENTPIRDIIADLNRYSGKQILLRDRSLGEIEYTFAFRADNVDLAVDVIADTLGVDMYERPNGDIELR